MILSFCDLSTYECTARFESFAPVRDGKAAWFVDGCDYLAAIATAINKVSPEVKNLNSVWFDYTNSLRQNYIAHTALGQGRDIYN